MGEIGSQYEQKSQALDLEHDTKMKRSGDALKDARRQWQDAIAEAKRKRQAKETQDTGPDKMQSPQDLLDQVQNKLKGLGDVLNQAANKTIGVKGTFNAAAAAGLGAGGSAERTAKATEETARNTKRLLGEARQGGLTFG